MKCPNCDWASLQGLHKFCPECGTQTVPFSASSDLVVICDEKLSDGTTCAASLTSGQKFCFLCGQKVDPQLFQSQNETCTKCGTILDSICVFCPECGMKKQKTIQQASCVTSSGDSSSKETSVIEAVTRQLSGIMSTEEAPVGDTGDNEVTPESGDLVMAAHDEVSPPAPESRESPSVVPGKNDAVGQSVKHGSLNIEDITEQDQATKETAHTISRQLIEKMTIKDQPELNQESASGETPIGNLNIQNVNHGQQDVKGTNGVNLTDEQNQQEPQDSDHQSNEGDSFQSIESKKRESSEYREGTPPIKRAKEVESGVNEGESRAEDKVREADVNASLQGEKEDVPQNSKSIRSDQKENSTLAAKVAHISTKNEAQRDNTSTEQKRQDNIVPYTDSNPTEETQQDPWAGLTSNDEFVFGGAVRKSIEDPKNNFEPALGKDLFVHKPGKDKTASFGRNDDIQQSNDEEASYEVIAPPDLEMETENVQEDEEIEGKEADDGQSGLSRRQKKNQKAKEGKAEQTKLEKDKKNETNVNKSASKNTNNNQTRKTDKTLVMFHILVSPDFNLKENDKVVLLFGASELGGWSRKDRYLRRIRTVDDYIEMEIGIEMEYYYLTRDCKYKYGIIRTGKEKFLWENYYDRNKYDKHDNRRLTVTYQNAKKEIWHQYDGIVIPSPKDNIFKKGFDWIRGKFEKNYRTNAEIFGRIVCPEWFHTEIDLTQLKGTITESVGLMECLLSGLRNVYFVDAGCWESDTEFKRQVCGKMLLPLIDHLFKESSVDKNHSVKIIRAISILLLCVNINMKLDEKVAEKLAKCLLVHPDHTKRICVEIDSIEQYFGKKRQNVLDALLDFVKTLANFPKNPSWLFCMPLVHFLSDTCQPFDQPKRDLNHAESEPVWWGTHKIQTAVQQFKRVKGKWALSFDEILDNLLPLFEMDFYLPRTIMTAIHIHELQTVIEKQSIPVEVCCATLVYYMKTTRPTYYTYSNSYANISTEEKTIIDCQTVLIKQLKAFSTKGIEVSETVLNHWFIAYMTARDVLKEALSLNRPDSVKNSTHVFVHTLSIFIEMQTLKDNQDDANKPQTRQHTEPIRCADAMVGEALTWLAIYASSWNANSIEQNLESWNNLIVENLASDDLKQTWNDHLLSKLSQKLTIEVCATHRSLMPDFVQLYCQKVESYTKPMQECLNVAAFKAMEKGYSINYGGFTEGQKIRFGHLLSKMYLGEWTKLQSRIRTVEDVDILRMALSWSPFQYFLNIFYTNTASDQADMLNDECREYLVVAVSIVEKFFQNLETGSILIGDLRMIAGFADKFPTMIKQIKQNKGVTKELVQRYIDVRTVEVKSFLDQAELMSTLTTLCTYLAKVDMAKVDSVLDKKSNIERHQVLEFCKPIVVGKMETEEIVKPNLTAFQVSEEMLCMAQDLQKVNASFLFMKMWTDRCNKMQTECTVLAGVLPQIWVPVQQSFKHLSKKIVDGTITFTDMERLIAQIFKDDYDRMLIEMSHLDIDETKAKKRISQLKNYRQLETCVEGAQVILKFVQEYGLKGNFEQIKELAAHHNKTIEMRQFNASLMNTCDILRGITHYKAACLDAFVKCGNLVKWLKESMTSGLKELKVFVDLAFMSAGDEPINIARVQCLHSAVTGFAPLIFDLDTDAGYVQLLQKCEIVWKELESNKNLPKKLVDTNRQLEWLKDIKKAHGSVEVTSLFQADAINARGIYTIGKNAKADGKLVSSSILKLTVREDEEGKAKLRNYNLDNLKDLQSRLMLVAGKAEKGGDGVDRFTMIFDSVRRLYNVYEKLSLAGCVLYKDWTARLMCDRDPRRPVCAVLQFGLGEDVPQLKGRRTNTEELTEFIPELAKCMEKCLEEWLGHIQDQRMKYLDLNYFTVDQLVILQQELVKIGTDREPSHLIYPLLSAVKDNCSLDDLLEAMTLAQQEIAQDNVMEEAASGEAEATEEISEDDNMQIFIQELVNAGYDEALAVKAAEHHTPDQVTEGIIWCMDHEEENAFEMDTGAVNHSAVAARGEELVHIPAFSGWSQSDRSIQSVITSNIASLSTTKGGVGVEPLIRDLTTLWQKFLGSITSNIKDYLSLEHLGLILGHLAQKNEGFHIERSLPPGFERGCPNLIICPSEDVLSVLLSLYMLQKDQPLPQSDEVLICTANTTIDEVDIFWRRAIFDGCSKIHCLVNADLLNFDVSEKAEKCVERYMQETNYAELQYQLVVICGSNNEYRSQIVSSLDKHRRPPLPFQQRHLQNYLATKLRIEQQRVGKVRPASSVDFNNSSVRLIKSWRSGVGKTLYMKRRENDLDHVNKGHDGCDRVSIPLQERNINLHYVIERLLEQTAQPDQNVARIFHIDVAHEVQEGVDYLLFNLLVLGCLMDKTGYVWRKSPTDLYLIETMPLMVQGARHRGGNDLEYVHQMLSLLPDMTCRSPLESSQIYHGNQPSDFMQHDQLFDQRLFKDPVYQRPFQYLLRLDNRAQLETVNPLAVEGKPKICLQTLIGHCGMHDPSWAELHHFVWFLNTQLCAFEKSGFVGPVAAESLPGFSTFVLRFLIQMSRDFSTRSLDMSEESPGVRYEPQTAMEMDQEPDQEEDQDGEQGAADLQRYQMRRTWESSPHPYLFFNADQDSFTFLGFNIDRTTGNVIDLQTRQVLITAVMNNNLFDALVQHRVPMNENFDNLPRHEQIDKLCKVIGQEMPHDPDDSYELTTDNVKKILAIYMRFRCDIPVIIMGETGCGKTTLIKFMCALQAPPGVDVKNMILMKVHGGTTNEDIIKKVREAEKIAAENVEKYGRLMYTVLFFDEANTTEAIGLIKEIMCDKSMEGRERKFCENLKMVAACNPYRKHSKELIEKLEQAGLGYHVDADETTDKLGRVPMRRLVYRVQPLPQSLLPLVWDFGQLNTQVEDLYIRQMVKRYIREDNLPEIGGFVEVVSAILTASQDYMRQQKNECSFVSLRDVDRVLCVMSWFYERSQGDRTLYNKMDTELHQDDESDDDEDEEAEDEDDEGPVYRLRRIDDVTRSLVLALGVCYHACLKTRDQYREHIAPYFRAPCQLYFGANQIGREIICCQDVFLDNVQLENNIARNMALKENLFMMVVCIELRIPLFLVGKPGSSKSLAKTIVSDAMQGNAAREALFKELKQAQMVSFQCSPLSTPDGILGTFRQCAQFQKDKDLNSFVSIVVLDEVGLAEDSPRMPLKTLHPLLEDGCQGDETPQPYMKVAFIGISNWALDPAKMNRGILVQREVPDLEELQNSARGICSDKRELKRWIEPLIEPLSVSYLEIFKLASELKREFFGLRDFYSLVKMIYLFAEKSHNKPSWCQILHAIKRNFGGLDHIDPEDSFRQNLAKYVDIEAKPIQGDPDCTASGLIRACLFDINQTQSESRYLLLLTENYGALTILQQQILDQQTTIRPITIFGSSFRSDLEYTQVCRNINKIKVCMETGNTVVLLNLENLYESLYDALNQYYVYFGGERYVDLGLGTHRVKCPVHRDFRLIVVAEKQKVYDKFPIPLINRLEKHFLTINTMLSRQQLDVVKQLENWAQQFAVQKNMNRLNRSTSNKVGDVFMGYHADTCSAIVLHVWPKDVTDAPVDIEQVLREAKATLLWCATPEAVARLEKGNLSQERQTLTEIYNYDQKHDSIFEYLHYKLVTENAKQLFSQVTTHSKLLAGFHTTEISKATGILQNHILLLQTLSSFDTEQQFSNRIQHHLQHTDKDASLLIIQCDSGDINANLVACARYCVRDEYQKVSQELRAPVHVVFIVQLPRIAGGCFTGFQCGVWHSVHIDDLGTPDIDMPSIQEMQDKTVSQLVSDAVHVPMDMEVDIETENESINQSEPMELDELPSNHGPFVASTDQNPQPSTSNEGQISDSSSLQMEDIIVNFEEAGRSPMSHDPKARGTSYHGNKLNVNALILACVHSALSMVKDKEDKSSRVTERTTSRVSLILELFHHRTSKGDRPFLEGVSRLIADLLKEKEKDNIMAKQWLVNEAAKPESIQKAGTFRRACQQTLESKIYPILAGIIGHLDTNQNLDLLPDQLSWKQDMWLSVLNVPGALQLKYSDLKSPTRQSDLQEVIVMTTGCEGHMFHGQMPFSWLLHNLIVDILKTPADINIDEEEMSMTQKVDLYVGILGETPLGHILHGMQDFGVIEEVIQDYLQDFVHTVYHAGSEEEQQLVMQSIHNVASRMSHNQQEAWSNPSVFHRLIFIHQAYQELAPRLTYFRTMNNVWPECSKRIVAVKTQNPDHFMFQEQEFTFSALCLLIENLAPVKNDLDNVAGRSRWLNMVHQYRPVIEKVISLHAEDPEIYGAHGFRSVQRARCMWSRVVVMKLFLEHVCVSDSKDTITIKQCMPLWVLLGDGANLKEVKSMEAVEKFLKMCNKSAMKAYMGKEEHCCNCEAVLEGPPIVLPCKDLVCDGCYHDLVALGDRLCPNQACVKPVPVDWNPERQVEKKNERAQLKEYQKRCNTFFMDIVSQLSFADNTPPTDEVINKLLGYITCTTHTKRLHLTKELTIFDSGIDPNPVFRSFLLQLLLRTIREDKLKMNLGRYLEQAETLLYKNLGTDGGQQYIELCQLVIQCLEDMFIQEVNKSTCDEVTSATNWLRHARLVIDDDEELTVDKLYGLAEARIGLAVTAKCIAETVEQNDDGGRVGLERGMRKLLEAAHDVCLGSNLKWPKTYLIKYICRRYGIDTYQTASRSQQQFIRLLGTTDQTQQQVVEVCDRFVVCDDIYTQIREALTKVILEEDPQQFIETIQGMHAAGAHVETMVQLALYREVTCSNLYPPDKRNISKEVLDVLSKLLQDSDVMGNKNLLQALLSNNFGHACNHLTIQEGENMRNQGIQCLLLHFLSVMSQLQVDRTLMGPLLALMNAPHTCGNMYLPTMPQDDLEDVKEALMAARNTSEENPVFYRCPNGHPYVIGDCGRPYYLGKCKCGADIGGQRHQLLAGNRQDMGVDATVTGHILGRANIRGQGHTTERLLAPVYCGYVRLITHMAMYLGANNNAQGIQNIIKPDLQVNGVADFLWQHILADLNDLQRGQGRSGDDIILLAHSIITKIMNTHNQGDHVGNEVCGLTSKKGRQQWEERFSNKYLQPILHTMEQTLKTNNQLIMQDKRLGSDPLLCLLYEVEGAGEQHNPGSIQNIPAVWRFRTPISLNHLRQEFETQTVASGKKKKKPHRVLQLFLEEEHNLRAIRYIPSILRLHRALIHKYQRKLDKAEASVIVVEQLRKEEILGPDTNSVLQDYIDAWELVRKTLENYLCPTEVGGMFVAKEYCRPITDQTQISHLLPTTKEAGLCSYALLDYLTRKQNDFLDKYMLETKSIPVVSPRELTSAHLISYDPTHDILPLVLANCQYSFEIGKGNRIEYDFTSLERQLMDRFLFSKSRIDVGRFLQVDQMVYRAEFTNAAVFQKLAEKIPQEDLNAAVKSQICGDFRSLPDLCESLDHLDITISFLKSIGGQPGQGLETFMTSKLKMTTTLHSDKAKQICKFRHAQSLWMLLSLEKSKRMDEQGQPIESIFESVTQEFHIEPEKDAEIKLHDYMKVLSVEKLSQLVAVMHEYIVLKVAVRENREDEDYTDTSDKKLHQWLYGYVEGLDMALPDLLPVLNDFPKDLLHKHSVHTWILMYRKLKLKQTGSRRY